MDDLIATSNTLAEEGADVIFVNIPGMAVHRVPLVVGTDMDVNPLYEIELVEQFNGLFVTLRLNQNGRMVTEVPLFTYSYQIIVGDINMCVRLRVIHNLLCWKNHPAISGLSEESLYCICLTDILLKRSLGVVSSTSTSYVPYYRMQPLLEELDYFSLTQFSRVRRVEFLINLGRKIKNQAHRSVLGDWSEIPTCFYHHIRTASETISEPLTHEQLKEIFEYFREVLIGLISKRESYKEPLCWKLKDMITNNMDQFKSYEF